MRRSADSLLPNLRAVYLSLIDDFGSSSSWHAQRPRNATQVKAAAHDFRRQFVSLRDACSLAEHSQQAPRVKMQAHELSWLTAAAMPAYRRAHRRITLTLLFQLREARPARQHRPGRPAAGEE